MIAEPLPTPKPPRADAERNRRRVLDAATLVFAQSGPSATLNDVALAAGVGIGTIYRKFPDKEALLDALFDDKIDTVMQVALDAARIDDAGLAFRSYLLGMIEVHAADRSLATVLFAPNRVERFPPKLAEQLASTADGIIAKAVEAGELRRGFTRQDTTVLAVMVRSIATTTRQFDANAWRRYAQIVVDGTRPTNQTEPLAPEPLAFARTAEALGRAL
jgi:AcrR family transcriptional regulator